MFQVKKTEIIFNIVAMLVYMVIPSTLLQYSFK